VFGIGDEYKTEAAWTSQKPHNENQVGGCYMNLGPTGIRARLHELTFEVKYVFPKSPADGLIQPGDVIVGAGGKPFATPHTFGFDWDKAAKKGYEGPMMDLGIAIEEAETKEGVLSLMIKRADKPSTVKIPIRPLGRFASTFPYKCKKSDQIFREICDTLAETVNEWSGGGVVTATCGLALLSSGDPRYLKAVERAAKSLVRINPLERGGLNNWNLVYSGIFLGEYYLATGDRSVLPAMMEIHKGLVFAQTSPGVYQHQKDWGGYPELGIMEGLAIMAWAMMDKCGAEFDPETYVLVRKRVRWITRKDGAVLYARDSKPGWEKEPIELDGGRGPYEGVGRGGAAMLGYYLTGREDPQADAYARNVGAFLTEYQQYFPDCHACPGVGIHLMGLGLACGYPEGFRKVMDYHKAYLNLMRSWEPGQFIALPSRSNACDIGFPRQFTSANVALLLGVKEKKLQISGAPLKPGRSLARLNGVAVRGPSPAAAPEKPAAAAEPKPAAEAKPKPVAKPEAVAAWDAKLRSRLAEALGAGRRLRFRFSIVDGAAELASIDGGGGVKIRSGGSEMALAWPALPADDRKGLALALADDGTAPDFALAAFFSLATGDAAKAEGFLARAGAAADEVRAAFQ